MSKSIIAALVGGLILFIWQFMSWGMLNLHSGEMLHTEHQDEILALLASNNVQEGDYFLPNAPNGASGEENQAVMQENIGKPWATISYHKSLNNNMPMNMARSFLINFLAAFLLFWLLSKIPNIDFKTALLSSLAVGIIGYLINTYINSIWFEGDTVMALIDAIVSWGLVGAWFGYYLNRN
jgi:hypothetical protein